MSESDERHTQDPFQNEDEPDVEGHTMDTFAREDAFEEKGREDAFEERERTDEAI